LNFKLPNSISLINEICIQVWPDRISLDNTPFINGQSGKLIDLQHREYSIKDVDQSEPIQLYM
jgi:hypothetical protein